MDSKKITSIIGALNLIQSWFNKKNYAKVIQGASEILEIDPKNPRALAFYHRAQDLLWQEQNRFHKPEEQASEQASEQAPETAPKVESIFFHLEEKPESTFLTPAPMQESRRQFLTIFVSALAVLLFGFAILYWANSKKDPKVPSPKTQEQNAPINPAYLEQNSQRIEDLNLILNALEAFKLDKGRYPRTDEVLEVLAENAAFQDGIVLDPKHGDIDRRGAMYGYIYQPILDDKEVPIFYNLSALFEDSKGLSYPWSHGLPRDKVEKFRDLKATSLLIE